jgi:hypothetical protein
MSWIAGAIKWFFVGIAIGGIYVIAVDKFVVWRYRSKKTKKRAQECLASSPKEPTFSEMVDEIIETIDKRD